MPSAFGEKASSEAETKSSASLVSKFTTAGVELPLLPAASVAESTYSYRPSAATRPSSVRPSHS